jgi:hypothetical protein
MVLRQAVAVEIGQERRVAAAIVYRLASEADAFGLQRVARAATSSTCRAPVL